jgi:hypothetical protein
MKHCIISLDRDGVLLSSANEDAGHAGLLGGKNFAFGRG